MEVELSDKTIDKIAERVADKIKSSLKTDVVNTKEAAKILGISESRVRRLAQTGKLPCVKQGESKQGRLLFYREFLLNKYLGE